MHRRSFIQRSAAAIFGAACVPLLRTQANAITSPQHILVLGGTHFLGPAIVEAAMTEGHTVTLFNRGVTNPDLFPHIEKLRGFRSSDPRDQDLSALAHRQFDAAVDVWPSDPAVVASAAEFLKDHVRHYLYVSSVAAYDFQLERAGIEENAPLEAWNGPARGYNRSKAESERRLHSIRGGETTIVRPGPIKGTRDTTPDLLTWLIRAQNGGVHIGPGTGEDPVELVDVKDVARFLLFAIHGALDGTFNLTGRPMSFRQFLDACKTTTRSEAKFEWIPLNFLREHGLDTDSALNTFAGNFPLWRPAGTHPALFQVSSEKAFRAGWQIRAFQETALDCLSYFRSVRENLAWDDYLSEDRERQILDAWAHRVKR